MSSSLAPATPAAAINSSVSASSSTSGSSNQRNAPVTNNTAAAAASTTAAGVVAASAAQFREIHKNTWLKRLSADGKKITVGPKKSEGSWVVFCVHDDTEAFLEGYAEPRQAAAHLPEWVVPLRDTLHISHALIPNSHEFEFVVTLSNEVLRFHAVSWEIMQEWVETLRSKLREMKILSPRENLYTKLPEVRAPLLPTRDPTSPLPAPPPVPAAIVPGVERVVTAVPALPASNNNSSSNEESAPVRPTIEANPTPSTPNPALATVGGPVVPPRTAMSNTLTQHLLNMLSDPISTYSEQINETVTPPPVNGEGSDLTENEANLHSTNDSDLNLSDDEFLSPLLRKACVQGENGVRVDVATTSAQRASADQILNLEHMLQCERLIPRPQTSRSMSAGAADKSKKPRRTLPQPSSPSVDLSSSTSQAQDTAQDNVTIIQVSSEMETPNQKKKAEELPPRLPPKGGNSSAAEIFRFPEINTKVKTKTQPQPHQQEYKSNVQIIPSNSSTIQVHAHDHGQSSASGANSNPYTMPVKANVAAATAATPSTSSSTNTTMVHVVGEVPNTASSPAATTVAVYGTCYPTPAPSSTASGNPSTPKLSKKIILSANPSGVTNISISNENTSDPAIISGNVHYEKVFLSASIPISSGSATIAPTPVESPRRQAVVTVEKTPPPATNGGSPALPRRIRRGTSPPAPQPVRQMPQLTRGLTELVISTRPSRRDFHYLKLLNTPLKVAKTPLHKTSSSATNNNIENGANATTSNSTNATPVHVAVQRTNAVTATASESVEQQRRRSSSTSDAQAPLQRMPIAAAATPLASSNNQSRANNNEFVPARNAVAPGVPPFRPSIPSNAANVTSPNKRLTLREQQVMQLRREIMHPGGVRLNLRRKDCVGSIAWVDAFGGVWIAGWKQKEHPVLYNALHIGDQLLSIAGVSISSAAEANKIIRNTNTLFVEVLLRRIPFGRAYAIRRDREGQCLGLIRDGNTSTIVDIVPNSLAARHGLPPKAQSCDGTALTFWILTEINGRPLNLFFKDFEIRDRLNAVGRDISLLVQPSDLITKLKKQLKSLRGYKDYLVQ